MMTKHTAGKWIDRGTYCVGSHRQLVASVYPIPEENPEEHAANMRLIAAAPDLLEALQYAVEQVPELGSVPGISAAIARATGEQP